MSIVNAFVAQDVAIIGVDTESLAHDGASRPAATKIHFLPHLSAAVAFRGNALSMAIALSEISMYTGDFDGLGQIMPELVRHTREITLAQAPRIQSRLGVVSENMEPANYVLVGYSESAARMVGHAYTIAHAGAEVDIFNDFPQVIAPAIMTKEEIASLGIATDRAGMERLSLEQCRLGRERLGSEFIGGGDLYITEIRKGRTLTEWVCAFPSR